MKWLVITISGLTLTAIVFAISSALPAFTPVRQVGEDKVIGMTTSQIIAKYGPPDHRSGPPGEELLVYYKGDMGGGTGLTFHKDIVTHVEMRGAR